MTGVVCVGVEASIGEAIRGILRLVKSVAMSWSWKDNLPKSGDWIDRLEM